jgi:hypothetical protein
VAEMKNIHLLMGIVVIICLAVSASQFNHSNVQESIKFFPIDPKVTYKNAQTKLSLMESPPNKIKWRVFSNLDQIAYLRQDASLLYSDGRLIKEIHDWKQKTDTILQEKQLDIQDSSLLQSITFHHAELHEKENDIYSSQTMSGNQLYVIQTNAETKSFRVPNSKDEMAWKKKLDNHTERFLQLNWNKAVRHFAIKLDNYQAFPLTELSNHDTLPGFTRSETARIIGNLWEGLYKNYLLGIKTADGTIESPIGSTVPLILVANNKKHLLVIFETAKGKPTLLRQLIPDTE